MEEKTFKFKVTREFTKTVEVSVDATTGTEALEKLNNMYINFANACPIITETPDKVVLLSETPRNKKYHHVFEVGISVESEHADHDDVPLDEVINGVHERWAQLSSIQNEEGWEAFSHADTFKESGV